MNLLFVCTAAQKRSPTAAFLFSQSREHKAKFAGINPLSEIPLTAQAIIWSDLIFVMEEIHRNFMLESFSSELKNKEIHVLNIPDIYEKNNPELIKILKNKLKNFL